MKVKLRDVVDGLEMQADEMTAYLNKRTGELVPTTSEDLSAAEEEEDLDDYPEWQRESILKAKEILASEDWIALPSKFEMDEYSMMEDFCRSIADPKLSDRLLNTIRGSGAFSRFRGGLEAMDLRQEWYDFRASELEKIAVGWLEENEIEYARIAESQGS